MWYLALLQLQISERTVDVTLLLVGYEKKIT